MTRVVDLFFKADDITPVMQSELLICFPKEKQKQNNMSKVSLTAQRITLLQK